MIKKLIKLQEKFGEIYTIYPSFQRSFFVLARTLFSFLFFIFN